MPAKELLFDLDARDQLRSGIDALAKAIKVTLGPRGRTVAVERKWGPPTVINTSEVAGDGTTTSTVVAQAIVLGGLRNLSAGANPMLMKRGIDRACEAVVTEIKRVAMPVQGHADIERIATISAN